MNRHQRKLAPVSSAGRTGSLRSIALATSVLLVLAACGASDTAQPSPSPQADVRELFIPTDAGYSQAARFGDLVWTAGHLPLGVSEEATFAEQVDYVLDGLEVSLESAGAGFDTLLKTNVYLLDFDDWGTFNTIYVERIGAHGLPPRTTVQVARLGYGQIEIEMVAYVRASSDATPPPP